MLVMYEISRKAVLSLIALEKTALLAQRMNVMFTSQMGKCAAGFWYVCHTVGEYCASLRYRVLVARLRVYKEPISYLSSFFLLSFFLQHQ